MAAAPATCAGVGSVNNAAIIGSAASTNPSASGASSVSTQHSNAEVIRPTSARSPAAIAPASMGTTRLASAPPATISNTMLGMMLAAW